MYFTFCTSPGIFCSPCVHKTARLNTTIQKAHDAGRMDNTGRASVEEEGKFNSYTNKQCLHDRKPFPVEQKKKSTQSDTVTSGIIHTSGCVTIIVGDWKGLLRERGDVISQTFS